MAIFENVEIWWVKIDPKRPVKNRDASKSDYWELQIRTTDKEQVKEWREGNLRVKAVREDKDDEESPILYYRANLRKKVKKANGEDTEPVACVGGDLSSIDPKKIGNGSKANIRVFQYDYEFEGTKGIANMLMAVQITELNEYVPKGDDETFAPTEFKVNRVADNGDQDDDDDGDY